MATPLTTLINRMNRFQSIATVEEQYKVRDLDDAIRTIKRNHRLPWYQKKGSLKVFADILEYPTASDHDYLIYLDRQQQNLAFGSHIRAQYTSLKDFYEDPTNRNDVAEIWENGALSLGVRINQTQQYGLSSQELDTASSITNHTISGDSSALTVDNVNYKTGNSSLQFSVTQSTNITTIEHTFTGFTDAEYKRKYHFRWVYLDGAPTSIALRFGADSSNYLTGTATTQFSGAAFVADQWNLVAFNLNGATEVGTISTTTSWAYEAVILNSAPTGVYNIDASYSKGWMNLDYWYYSRFTVQTVSASQADQEYFYNSSDVYAADSNLVGPSEWADVVMYDAMATSLTDKENSFVLGEIKEKRELAWQNLESAWPDLKPQMITNKYRFQSDYTMPMNNENGHFGL